MSKRKRFRKRERYGVRKFWYIFIMVILAVMYLCGQQIFEWKWLTEVFATGIAIVTAVAFWLEYRENKLLNEAQFITDLNEQFIGNEKMSDVEWKLEKFYNKYKNKRLTEEDKEAFRSRYDIENKDRQNLVNYLVHLEGIAALVKNGFLHIDTIDDLMSYRYFIAMNNPIVQDLELCQYPDFYKGCYGIYDAWVEELGNQKSEIPMIDDYKLPEFEEVKACLQKTDR